MVTSLSFVQCIEVNDTYVLSSSPNVKCFSRRHKVFAFAFLLVFIIVTVGGQRGGHGAHKSLGPAPFARLPWCRLASGAGKGTPTPLSSSACYC